MKTSNVHPLDIRKRGDFVHIEPELRTTHINRTNSKSGHYITTTDDIRGVNIK